MYVSAETFWAGLGVVILAVTTVASAFLWLGRLSGRVTSLERQMAERAEERQAEREDRERERQSYREDMRALDRKLDNIFARLGTVEQAQSGQSATLKAVAETLGKLERTLDRRGLSP